MRKAFFEEIGGEFNYSFGSDVSIIYAVMTMPGVKGRDLEYYIELTGTQLIKFIKKSAKGHEKIIEEIDPEKRYLLKAWDW